MQAPTQSTGSARPSWTRAHGTRSINRRRGLHEGEAVLIGAMNHPAAPVLDEIESIAGLGLDFVDLTLEPPDAASWRVDPAAIRDALRKHNLPVVGHTAFYLPMGSAIEELRAASVAELRRALQAFSAIGAAWMNVHPDRHAPMHGRDFYIKQNLRSFEELLLEARRLGMGVMIE